MALNRLAFGGLRHKHLPRVVLFIVVFFTGYLIASINHIQNYWEQFFTLTTAKLAAQILTYLGMDIYAKGNLIAFHEFSVVIGPGCIAFYEIFVFSAAIIAYPLKKKDKLAGVLLGVVAVWATNLLRVIGLFLSGIYFPSIFKLLHDHVAQAIFILFMVVLWISWVEKCTKRIAEQ